MKSHRNIDIVIPAYNESKNIKLIHSSIAKEISRAKDYVFTIIFVNDGSRDTTLSEIESLKSTAQLKVKYISFSRNFGKEAATTAGLHHSTSEAAILLDADGQHPVNLIPTFIKKWEAGAKVVIGVRKTNKNEGFVKKYGSKMFYKLFNSLSGSHLIPGSTDFRLIDRIVLNDFVKLKEQNRITRGLVDWLGYEKDYVHFNALERVNGSATYTPKKLTKLALDTFVSMSFTPLFIMGYLGALIVATSLLLGILVIINLLLGDALNLDIKGSGYLGIMTLGLVGLVLVSNGITSIYISKIYSEVKQRPLYLVDHEKSVL